MDRLRNTDFFLQNLNITFLLNLYIAELLADGQAADVNGDEAAGDPPGNHCSTAGES
jgi:hypothetical protein